MKTIIQRRYHWLLIVLFAIVFSAGLTAPSPSYALFGAGDVVFDPTMYASQLQQLQQETATVRNLASQLQYMIQNTTGGSAGAWKSNQTLLSNLGGLISEQEGLSYSFQGLSQHFQQLYPGYQVTNTPGSQSPQEMTTTTLNTLNGALASTQAQAQNFKTEQATLQQLEFKNQTAIGNLQAIQISNELALAQVQQIQLLRQLVMAQINSQNVAAANQVNAQVQSNLAAQAIFSKQYPGDSFNPTNNAPAPSQH